MIGYYEAPDGENEALFIADRIRHFSASKPTLLKAPRTAATAPCSTAPTRNRALLKKRCAATASATPWSAASASTSAPRSRTCSAICASSAIRTTPWRCSASSICRHAASAPPRSLPLSASRLKPACPHGRPSARPLANHLICSRAPSIALQSFRQLIIDAQAMMDPDFAGKLTADVAVQRRNERRHRLHFRRRRTHPGRKASGHR